MVERPTRASEWPTLVCSASVLTMQQTVPQVRAPPAGLSRALREDEYPHRTCHIFIRPLMLTSTQTEAQWADALGHY